MSKNRAGQIVHPVKFLPYTMISEFNKFYIKIQVLAVLEILVKGTGDSNMSGLLGQQAHISGKNHAL